MSSSTLAVGGRQTLRHNRLPSRGALIAGFGPGGHESHTQGKEAHCHLRALGQFVRRVSSSLLVARRDATLSPV